MYVCEEIVDLADLRSMLNARSLGAAAVAAAALIAPAAIATAEEVVLRPGYQVGDRYGLDLTTETKTRVDARGARSDSFREDVELHYSAQVEVLATDPSGAPVRERHADVVLRYVRPGDEKSLFKEGAAFELSRHSDGSVEIRVDGARMNAKVEKIVGDLLAHQTEYALSALLDPGRPVTVGERWELEPDRVRSFLVSRGIRDIELDGPATAELGAGKGDRLALRYRIPIRAFALPDLPEGTDRMDSEGRLTGELELAAGGLHRVRTQSSSLALEIDGRLQTAGAPHPARWNLRRSQSVDQQTEMLRDQLAASR
jgi:hypothetical protein